MVGHISKLWSQLCWPRATNLVPNSHAELGHRRLAKRVGQGGFSCCLPGGAGQGLGDF